MGLGGGRGREDSGPQGLLFSGASSQQWLSDSAQELFPGLQPLPKTREMTGLVLRHLLPSTLLHSWHREAPSGATCSQSLQGPLRIPKAKEGLCPLSWHLGEQPQN